MSQNDSTAAGIDLELAAGFHHAVQASAGTGKTWLTTSLLVRLLAEQEVTIDQVLVITFTRAATAELRERLRKRIAEAREFLEGSVAAATASDDGLLMCLAALAPDVKAQAKQRLCRAAENIDRAAIHTIHAFAQSVLQRYALEAGVEPGLLTAGGEALRQRLRAELFAEVHARLNGAESEIIETTGFRLKRLDRLMSACTGAVDVELVEDMWAEALTRSGEPAGAIAAIQALNQPEYLGTLAFIADCDGAQVDVGVRVLKKANLFKRNSVPKQANKLLGAIRAGTEVADALFGATSLTLSGINSGFTKDAEKARANDGFWQAANQRGFKNETFENLGTAIVAARTAVSHLGDKCMLKIARTLRARWSALLEVQGVLTFDGMLTRLAEALDQPGPGESLTAALRAQYRAAFVDEFQDTDRAQWSVVQKVFLHEKGRLVVVGDPKQAIYSFRGADIETYKGATGQPEFKRSTLPQNRRTDAPLVAALDLLWRPDGQSVGHMGPGIDFEPVRASFGNRIAGWPVDGSAPENRRWLTFRTFASGKDWPQAPVAKRRILTDLACEVRALLDSKVEIERQSSAGTEKRALGARDIAVLVPTRAEATDVVATLRRSGVPAVAGNPGPVASSDAAAWVLAWLDALAAPDREAPARALAVTPLVGADPVALAADLLQSAPKFESAAAKAFSRLRLMLREIGEDWPKVGFARLFETFCAWHATWARLLSMPDGERHATDARHLIEWLGAEWRTSRETPGGLAAFLRNERSGEEDDDAVDGAEGRRQIETDQDCVRIYTQHGCKGLEFPVVLMPFGWRATKDQSNGIVTVAGQSGKPPRLAIMSTGGTEDLLGVVGKEQSEEINSARDAARSAEFGRLLYVAMTRAKHLLVVWVGKASSSSTTPLLRLVTGWEKSGDPTPDETVEAIRERLNHPNAVTQYAIHETLGPNVPLSHLATLVTHDASRRVPVVGSPGEVARGAPWVGALALSRETAPAPSTVPPGHQRVSFTRVSAGKSFTDAGLEEIADLIRDSSISETPARAELAPAAHLHRGGAPLGSLVHRLFEEVSFADGGKPRSAADEGLESLIERLGVETALTDQTVRGRIRDLLPVWLRAPIRLGSRESTALDDRRLPDLCPGFCLEDISDEVRADELGFDLPLGGRSKETEAAVVYGILKDASALTELQPATRAWLKRLVAHYQDQEAKIFSLYRGLLNGSIDLMFEATSGSNKKATRYWICDYKTNCIQGPGTDREGIEPKAKEVGEELRAWLDAVPPVPSGFDGDPRQRRLMYTQPLLGWEMSNHAYHLQTLIYTVAAVRLLKARDANFRDAPEENYAARFGGCLWLFVRGMGSSGEAPDAPFAPGVWYERWPWDIVNRLDAALCPPMPSLSTPTGGAG
jgi:ATP-dependent exoDNAse (exonuclease V) beta subunit